MTHVAKHSSERADVQDVVGGGFQLGVARDCSGREAGSSGSLEPGGRPGSVLGSVAAGCGVLLRRDPYAQVTDDDWRRRREYLWLAGGQYRQSLLFEYRTLALATGGDIHRVERAAAEAAWGGLDSWSGPACASIGKALADTSREEDSLVAAF